MGIRAIEKTLSSFTANEDAYMAVCDEIKGNAGSAIPQPVLIIGQEGSGKTTLLRRLISSYPDSHSVWIDGRSIFSAKDITDKTTDVTILIIDDLDYFLARCSYDEQFRLRRFLYNEGAPMLIASVSKLVPALTEYKAPFFEGLKKIHLPPINEEDLSSMFDDKSIFRALPMYSLVSPTIASVEIIYRIIELSLSPDNDLNLLLSHYSDKYRLIYESMPSTSQHILNTLGDSEEGMTLPEIRESSGLTSGGLSPYLKRLTKEGLITSDKTKSRGTKYDIKDPLFKIWLIKKCQ